MIKKIKNLSFLLLFTIGLITINSCENSEPDAPITLIAFYPFNSNANDGSINDNHGIVSGAKLTTDRKGIANSAYEFDGIDDYIEVIDFGNTLPTKDISVSLWVKSNTSKAQFQLMLCPDQNRFAISIDFKHSTINHTFWDFGWQGEGGNAPGRLYDFSEEFNTEWHHYVFVSSFSQGIMRIYKDGSLLVDKIEPRQLLNNSDKDLKIGSGDNGFYYNGKIDDIKIFNGVLSASKIYTLFTE